MKQNPPMRGKSSLWGVVGLVGLRNYGPPEDAGLIGPFDFALKTICLYSFFQIWFSATKASSLAIIKRQVSIYPDQWI